MRRLLLIHARNQSIRLATVSFSLPRLVHIRVSFPPGSTMACKYQNQYPIAYETCYRILLSLGRYCNIRQSPVAIQRSEAAVALDLLLELFAEKNLANAPWEFGYAVGGSRILASASPAKPCTSCRQSFAGGALKRTTVSVIATALASTTHPITPDRSSPGPFPGARSCASPQTSG